MNFSRRDIIVGTAATMGLGACTKDPAHVLFGKHLPKATLTTIDGNQIDIGNLQKPIIMHFTGLWCVTCINDMDYWHKALEKLNKISEIDVITIHSGNVPSQFGTLKHYWDKLDIKYKTKMVDDLDYKFANSLQIPGYPSTLHIDSGGRIIEHSWALKSNRGVKTFLMKTDEIFGLDNK